MIKRKLRMPIFLALIILVLSSLLFALADIRISIKIDSKEIQSDVAPQLVQNRTMVPIRVISEAIGAEVTWNQKDMTVVIVSPYKKFINKYADNEMYIKQAEEVLTLFKAGKIIILDVRGDTLRAKGFINDSIHIPLPQLLDRLAELPKDKAIAVYCAKNINASYAVAMLNMLDYEAYVLEDGMNAWLSSGGKNSYFST